MKDYNIDIQHYNRKKERINIEECDIQIKNIVMKTIKKFVKE